MPQAYVPYLVMAVAIIFMIRRNLAVRRIQAGSLWVFPTILIGLAALIIYQRPPRDTFGIAAMAAAGLAGCAVGWYRGKFTHITLDADTGIITGRGSVIGLALILVIYVGRYAVMTWAQSHPEQAGLAVMAADSALVFGFATLIVSRLEMWLRCRKLMAAAVPAA
jgi:hypothetical protein